MIHLLLVVVAAQVHDSPGPPTTWFLIATVPIRLVPFVAADVLMARARTGRGGDHGHEAI